MQPYFQSLSLVSVSVLVAVGSSIAAFLARRISSALIRWCAAILLPLVLSYCLYWLPIWLGADADRAQYSAWELLGVGVPFLAGLAASCVVNIIINWHARKHA